jgi:hypothetical protein
VVSGTSRVTKISLDQAGYTESLTSTSWNLDLSNNFLEPPLYSTSSTQPHSASLSKKKICSRIQDRNQVIVLKNQTQRIEWNVINWLVNYKIPEFGSLKNLYFLDASDNAISGNISASFPSFLVQISMRNNSKHSLEGKMIGNSFRNLGCLQVLDLIHNRLSGSIPAFLFDALPSLQQLVLSFNSTTSRR